MADLIKNLKVDDTFDDSSGFIRFSWDHDSTVGQYYGVRIHVSQEDSDSTTALQEDLTIKTSESLDGTSINSKSFAIMPTLSSTFVTIDGTPVKCMTHSTAKKNSKYIVYIFPLDSGGNVDKEHSISTIVHYSKVDSSTISFANLIKMPGPIYRTICTITLPSKFTKSVTINPIQYNGATLTSLSLVKNGGLIRKSQLYEFDGNSPHTFSVNFSSSEQVAVGKILESYITKSATNSTSIDGTIQISESVSIATPGDIINGSETGDIISEITSSPTLTSYKVGYTKIWVQVQEEEKNGNQ